MRGSGSGTAPKCHGSPTLPLMYRPVHNLGDPNRMVQIRLQVELCSGTIGTGTWWLNGLGHEKNIFPEVL